VAERLLLVWNMEEEFKMENLFYLVKTSDYFYKIPDVKIYFVNYGWTVIGFDKKYYDLFVSFGLKYFELTKDDVLGYKSFGDMRAEIKVLTDDELEQEYIPGGIEANQIKIPVTEHRYNCILNSMKNFAITLFEEEFDKRFKKLQLDFSELEKQTWEKQLEEVKLFYDGKPTPLIESLAEAKGISVEEYVLSIEETKEKYDNKTNTLFVELQSLKTTFKNVDIIEDMNLLYAKYFSIQLAFTNEFKQSRPDIFNDKGNFIEPLNIGYNF
jgi:hypothetical protein